MTEPTTAAGRAVLRSSRLPQADAILAIEAEARAAAPDGMTEEEWAALGRDIRAYGDWRAREARAAALDEARAAVEALPNVYRGCIHAVLAAIDALREGTDVS